MHHLATEIYALVRNAHEEIYKRLQQLAPQLQTMPPEELADVAYALRHCFEKWLPDCTKETKRVAHIAELLACQLRLTALNPDSIKTEYCTAAPALNTMAVIPTRKKDPDGYEKLMNYLGIDLNLRDRGKVLFREGEIETEVVKVHWPGFVGLLTRLAANGYPMPDGIDPNKTYTEYRLNIRSRKGVLDETPDNPF